MACREQSPSAADAGETIRAAVIFGLGGGREARFDAEVVTTPEDRARGLMYRTSLPESRGMLFVFDSLDDHVFWMKNTYIPLDMIFIGPDMTVAGIVHNAEPQTLNGRSAGKPSIMVLEINGGLSQKLGITTGAGVRILQATPRPTSG
jgi:uncharacterized membrane protein (UPF0127 family)